MADVIDILELDRPATPEVSKETILGQNVQKKKSTTSKSMKRPEGMARELYALLYSDNKDAPPLLPTDTGMTGYKQMKARLGMRRARPWVWMQFNNPARQDGLMLYHWRRECDANKEYPFAKFNKTMTIPSYTEEEYEKYLKKEGWTKAETDHLMSLAKQFDLRFFVMHDRWDVEAYSKRSIEDLKARYYSICNCLTKARNTSNTDVHLIHYDAEHEKKRKAQLTRLYNRTPEQIEEEQTLLAELKKIEIRKKERERKTQDLHKLIKAADGSQRLVKNTFKKKILTNKQKTSEQGVVDSSGIKFPDLKTSGVTLRSQRMKLPSSVGQKKMKAIEQLLQELGIDVNPMPTEDICNEFNELRSDMVLLYDLKLALATCEYELQTLRHQYEALVPGKTLEIPETLSTVTIVKQESIESPSKQQKSNSIAEMLDVTGQPGTPGRKRKAALEQGNVLKNVFTRNYKS